METPETWYMEDDDGNEKLSILMCPNPKAEEDEQGEIQEECCACDEAKYEVAFEGLWSRNTHPKVSIINDHKYRVKRKKNYLEEIVFILPFTFTIFFIPAKG